MAAIQGSGNFQPAPVPIGNLNPLDCFLYQGQHYMVCTPGTLSVPAGNVGVVNLDTGTLGYFNAASMFTQACVHIVYALSSTRA
jgi:hypothetical protein